MSDEDRAADIAADCRERRERGEAIDTDEVVRAHPGLELPLRAAFAAWRRLDEQFDVARAAPSRIGRALGPYRLVEELGAGGMGTVYLAESGNERVAVKVLHPHLCGRQGFLQRLRREADLGRRVRHANVVRTIDAATADCGTERLHFVVMEHVAGRTLRALLDDLGRVPEELCRHIGREVAKALDAIHAAGAIHRDLKPENVIITPEQAVKVMDLGVARLLDESMRVSQSGAFVGSVRYAAPEQFGREGEEVDTRLDLYSLGLTLYELATGTHPFAGDEFHVVLRKQLNDVPRPSGELNPQLSPFFEDLLARLVEKDRDRRIASAADLVRILDEGEESAWWRERSASIRAATRRPLRRIRIPRETALYGRDEQMAMLRSLYERAAAGDGQVLLIEGEAGIGKSRLVDEFVGLLCGFVVPPSGGSFVAAAKGNYPAEAGTTNLNFLYGSYPPGGAATASGAFSVAYREHLGDDEAAIRDALPQTPLLVPAFAALLSGDAAPAGAEPLTKDSLQTVFVHATRSIAATRPTIVLIDDLHFAPEEGRALFASLALAVPGHRILLVGCARPSLDGQWVAQLAGHEQATRLALPRLGPKELVHLLRDALKSERLAEELAALIAVKSDGNPFFVFELLRGLRDGQFLRQRADGTWETTQIIRDIQVPSSIAELVQARVADLEADDKILLDVAACCGFEFDPLVVAAALGSGEIAVLQRLARVEQRHRLVRSAGRRFVFDHHQVQEALYGGLPELLRERYHAAIAEAIETRTGAAAKEPNDVEGAVCVELVEHFLGGAKGLRARRYVGAAMSHLEKAYLNDAAIRLAERALAVPEMTTGRERISLLLRQAELLTVFGRQDASHRALEEARRLADADGRPEPRCRVLSAIGFQLNQTSRPQQAIGVLEEALELARAAQVTAIEITASLYLGFALDTLGRYADAIAALERARDLARTHGDRLSEARALGSLGLVNMHLGRLPESLTLHRSSASIADAIGSRPHEAVAVCSSGVVLILLNRRDEARAFVERALELSRSVGDRPNVAVALGSLANIALQDGLLADACEIARRMIELGREVGSPRNEANGQGVLAMTLLQLGRTSEARDAFERAIELARSIGYRWSERIATWGRAMASAETGHDASAETTMRELLAQWRLEGLDSMIASALSEYAAFLVHRGRLAEAQPMLHEAQTIARRTGQHEIGLVATASLAMVEPATAGDAARVVQADLALAGVESAMRARFALWRATQEALQIAEAKRLLDHLVAHAPEECRESMLSNVRLHREIAAAAGEHGIE